MGVALLFLVIIPSGWLAIAAHLLTLLAILLLMFPFLQRSLSGEAPLTRLFLLLPVLALIVGEFFHLNSVLYTLLRWPGPPASSLMLFNLGEFFAVLSPIALWWMWGRDASRRVWIGGLFPALFFAVLYIAAPAMTATIVIWSTGLTLYLPWPLYVLSIWLAGTTILACLHRRHRAAWGILLLAAAGYAPQFSVQIFFSLIALWVLISGCRDDSLPAQQPIESSQWRLLSAEASSLWRWQ
jgi:hypothetical protein